MQGQHRRMRFAFMPIEFACLQSLDCRGIGDSLIHARISEARKLGQEFTPAVANDIAEVATHVGEKRKRSGGAEFLTHEQ